MTTSGVESLASVGLEIAGIGLWKWDPATDAFDVDALAHELCGLERGERLTLARLGERLPVEDFRRFEAALHRNLSGAEDSDVSLECRISMAGVERWVAFSTSRWPACADDSQRCQCLVGTVRNITAPRRHEQPLESEHRHLDQQLRAQREMLAGTGHDLRNALASLQAAVHLFNKAGIHPDVRAAACMGLQVQVDRIARIANQLMSAAALEVEPAAAHLASAARAADGQPRPTTLAPHSRRTPPRKRVLVADDNADAASTLAMLLRMDGHDVMIALDGQQAVELSEKSHPEVLLLDLGMPLKDGIAVAREIKQQPWSTDCTLIAISGRDRREDRRRTLDAGFTRHLAKPFDFDELSRLLAES